MNGVRFAVEFELVALFDLAGELGPKARAQRQNQGVASDVLVGVRSAKEGETDPAQRQDHGLELLAGVCELVVKTSSGSASCGRTVA